MSYEMSITRNASELPTSHGSFAISDSDCIAKLKLDAATHILNEFLHSIRQIGYTDKMVLELIINLQG